MDSRTCCLGSKVCTFFKYPFFYQLHWLTLLLQLLPLSSRSRNGSFLPFELYHTRILYNLSNSFKNTLIFGDTDAKNNYTVVFRVTFAALWLHRSYKINSQGGVIKSQCDCGPFKLHRIELLNLSGFGLWDFHIDYTKRVWRRLGAFDKHHSVLVFLEQTFTPIGLGFGDVTMVIDEGDGGSLITIGLFVDSGSFAEKQISSIFPPSGYLTEGGFSVPSFLIRSTLSHV